MAYEKLNLSDGTVLKAEHVNHMEEGIAKANSMIETVGGDTLTWDGDTTGLAVFAGAMYKVSDVTPTLADFANGAFVTASTGEAVDIPVDEIMDTGEGAIISDVFMIVYGDVEGAPKGTYFAVISDGVYLTSLTIPGYTGFTKEIIKQDALPEALQFGDKEATIFEKQTVVADNGIAMITVTNAVNVGDAMKITYNETEYSCIAFDLMGMVCVGNVAIIEAGEDTGEPFFMVFTGNDVQMFVFDDTFSLEIVATIAMKIQQKYYDTKTTIFICYDGSYLYHDMACTQKITISDLVTLLKKPFDVSIAGAGYLTVLTVTLYGGYGTVLTCTGYSESTNTISIQRFYTAEYTET